MKKTNYLIYFHHEKDYSGIYINNKNLDRDLKTNHINSKFGIQLIIIENEFLLTKTDIAEISIPIDFFKNRKYSIDFLSLKANITLYFYDIPNDFQLEEHLSITEQINLPKDINFKKINNDLQNAYLSQNILKIKILNIFYKLLDREINLDFIEPENIDLYLNLNNVDYDNIKPITLEKIIK